MSAPGSYIEALDSRTHRDLVLVADFGKVRDFFGRLGVRHSDRKLGNIYGGPFGIPMEVQVFVVGADGIVSESKAQFRDGLSEALAKSYVELASLGLAFSSSVFAA
jgi:hypothetical protein